MKIKCLLFGHVFKENGECCGRCMAHWYFSQKAVDPDLKWPNRIEDSGYLMWPIWWMCRKFHAVKFASKHRREMRGVSRGELPF